MAPELAETVVMTAVVSVQIDDQEFLAPPALLQGTHWRAISYDVYTGYGWAISEERSDPTGAFQMIPVPQTEGQTTLTQFIYEQQDERSIRYTTGIPVRFEHATVVSWRGLDDLVRVRTPTPGPASAYKAVSRLTTAVPDALRQSRLADVPAPLLARYTVLPETTPQRVRDLAQEVAGEYENPYDQARALEQFLRQYPYSLDVPEPPYGADPVDYFLFDLQTGYCDYYASSMVVLARTLGLPARLAVGFKAQPPDEDGVQTLRQLNAHSWAEVYFAGYGWVEFEPTASFASPRDTVISAYDPANFTMEFEPPFQETYTPPPIPEARPFPWLRLLVLALITTGLLYVWWQQRGERALRADGVVWAYSRLQLNARKLGQPPAASQTPQEFADVLLYRLGRYGRRPRLRPTLAAMQTHINQITHLYNERRYGGQESGGYDSDEHLPVGQPAARQAWRKLRRPFWRLRFLHRFSRKL
jgi:transglutaminase-like putative cysteine protease